MTDKRKIITHYPTQADGPRPGDPISEQDRLYLYAERPEAEKIIRGAGSRRIMLNDLHRIYRTYFQPFSTISTGDISGIVEMLTDLYRRYDEWLDQNKDKV